MQSAGPPGKNHLVAVPAPIHAMSSQCYYRANMKQEHFEVLLEDINSKLTGLSEGISALPTREEFHHLRDDVEAIRSDVGIIKTAVKSQSTDLHDHAGRLDEHEASLEQLRQQAV